MCRKQNDILRQNANKLQNSLVPVRRRIPSTSPRRIPRRRRIPENAASTTTTALGRLQAKLLRMHHPQSYKYVPRSIYRLPIFSFMKTCGRKRGATNVPNPASFSQVSSRTLHKNMDDFCSWPSLVKRPHSVNDDEGRRNNDFSIDHANCNNRIILEKCLNCFWPLP